MQVLIWKYPGGVQDQTLTDYGQNITGVVILQCVNEILVKLFATTMSFNLSFSSSPFFGLIYTITVAIRFYVKYPPLKESNKIVKFHVTVRQGLSWTRRISGTRVVMTVIVTLVT